MSRRLFCRLERVRRRCLPGVGLGLAGRLGRGRVDDGDEQATDGKPAGQGEGEADQGEDDGGDQAAEDGADHGGAGDQDECGDE